MTSSHCLRSNIDRITNDFTISQDQFQIHFVCLKYLVFHILCYSDPYVTALYANYTEEMTMVTYLVGTVLKSLLHSCMHAIRQMDKRVSS